MKKKLTHLEFIRFTHHVNKLFTQPHLPLDERNSSLLKSRQNYVHFLYLYQHFTSWSRSPIFHNSVITPVSQLKYLGFIFDERLSFLPHITHVNSKAKTLYNVMRQIVRNLFGYSFRARRIMFFGILRSLYYYCSLVYYHRFLFKSYIKSISSAIRPLLITTSFSYKTVSTSAAHDLSITARSLRWLI